MDAPFAAGLIAGEAHFGIAANNGGQNWRCFLSVAMRADDTELVRALCALIDCGHIYRLPAAGGSRPRTCWSVNSLRGCVQVDALLASSPLLSKKRGEVAIWSEAVSAWARRRWSVMQRLASDIREFRGFVNETFPVAEADSDHFAGFLAGFATAEGHFGAKLPSGAPYFAIKLRADDRAVLEHFAKTVAVGRVREDRQAGVRPTATWAVHRTSELERLAAVLDPRPPLGQQGRVYSAWRRLLDEAARREGRRRSEVQKQRRRELAWLVRLERVYVAQPPLPRTDRRAERRARCVEALQAWRSQRPASYTAPSYERARRQNPAWPTRNTVAMTFGSWINALEAGGLPTQEAHSRARAARIGAAATARAGGRRDETRATVEDAVARCKHAINRWPRATEFFRWRLVDAPDAPSQATVYRAFPGGWDEVLAAAGAPRA